MIKKSEKKSIESTKHDEESMRKKELEKRLVGQRRREGRRMTVSYNEGYLLNGMHS